MSMTGRRRPTRRCVEGLGNDPAEVIREQGKVALTSGSAFGSPVSGTCDQFRDVGSDPCQLCPGWSVVAAHAS